MRLRPPGLRPPRVHCGRDSLRSHSHVQRASNGVRRATRTRFVIDVDDLGTKAWVTEIVDRKKPPLIRAELVEVAGKSVKG
jgi:hypothetical protein